MQRIKLRNGILTPLFSCLIVTSVQAAIPFSMGNPQASIDSYQTTLSTPLPQNLLALSIHNENADPVLMGTPREIIIKNEGVVAANNVRVISSGFPDGTLISSDTCTGMLNAGDTCKITVTPGRTASSDEAGNACTTMPGTKPKPATITISADNASPMKVKLLVLGYGCIYQGGYLFAVDEMRPKTRSIGGKVAALTDEEQEPGNFVLKWATEYHPTLAGSTINGLANTYALANPAGQYPAAQACLNKIDQNLTDWYLPAICEIGRYASFVLDAGCGESNPNLYSTLYMNDLGRLAYVGYWSSTEYASRPRVNAWYQGFFDDGQGIDSKLGNQRVRCIRAF